MSDWILSASKAGGGSGGCSIFPMIKAGPNCFDNIKDLAVAWGVRAVFGVDRLVAAGDSDSEHPENRSASEGPNSPCDAQMSLLWMEQKQEFPHFCAE